MVGIKKEIIIIYLSMVRLFPVKSMISINRSEICNSSSEGHLSDELRDTLIIPNRFNVNSIILLIDWGSHQCIMHLITFYDRENPMIDLYSE